MRKFRFLFIILLFLTIALGSFGFSLQGRYVVPIIIYHHVEHVQKPLANNVSPRSFARQMDYLKKHGYRVINLDELVHAIREKKRLQKSVVITFDDGNEDNYAHAFPILKQHGFPATIFVIAATVGEEGYLNWGEIKEMERERVVIGSHTLSHVYLPGVSPQEHRHQIFESKKILEEKLGHPVDYIAYPSGGFNEEIKTIVKAAGYKGACTTNRGYHRLNEDIYELKRIRLSDRDSNIALWVKFSGYYNLFRSLTDPY